MAARAGVTKRRISYVPATAPDAPSLSFMEDLFADEFPEAFGSSGNNPKSEVKSILDLPAEVLAIVCQDLSNLDIKRLRLTCKILAKNVDLRINRVYVSPNRANLQCLQKILDHPRYRHQVHELVWDDAQLEEYPDVEDFSRVVTLDEANSKRDIESMLEWYTVSDESDDEELKQFEHDDFFMEDGRLTEVAKGILLRHNTQSAKDVLAQNATRMSIEDSWDHYQDLYREEQEIMSRQLDVAALRQVLRACPNLRRVTLTSAIWYPWNTHAYRNSPFLQSLPPGFRKPSVWPWLTYRPQSTPAQAAYISKTLRMPILEKTGSLPREFRGYSILVSTLLNMRQSSISEFIIDPAMETTGISHQLFTTENADWLNTVSLASILPLTSLKLAVNSYGAKKHSPNSYLRSGHIQAVLRNLPLLKHFDLSPNCRARRDENSVASDLFSWRDIIPADLVERLKTLTIRNAYMHFDSVYDMVVTMLNAEHITLDNVFTHSDRGRPTYYSLFRGLWIHYETTQIAKTRPAFTIVEPIDVGPAGRYRARLTCEEVSYWLHGDEYHVGCPFEDRFAVQIGDGVGWVVDDRDPEFAMLASEWERTPEGRRWLDERRMAL
ncbi:hypothetical protein EK21DRAFT_114625 [Setomelanomma holmii]|uniref:F-box domain-containing protein n=1 Tax=Setomelanomma holmii TaxID=210430 RepID=A0A9P4LJZ9_9PLEO|nr:hypothetical protein EK21DRAFT_114625 [Setomelanomma holmii]